MKQRSEQWFIDRCGKITASRFKDVLAYDPPCYKVVSEKGSVAGTFNIRSGAEKLLAEKDGNARVKAKYSIEDVPMVSKEAREKYISEIVCERLTGEIYTIPDNFATAWGKDNEPLALASYETQTGVIVKETEFVVMNEYIGASPDGMVGDEGGIEIKCPVNSANHIKVLRTGEVPEEHIPQIQGQMMVTGIKWVDFVSFDPRMPEKLTTFIKRVERDDVFIKKLEKDCGTFNNDVIEVINQLLGEAKAA